MPEFFLQELMLKNFKNIKKAHVKLNPKFNCLIGLNGAGKTNLLDAIYYLSFTKSYFNTLDNQIITHNKTEFFIKGIYSKNNNFEEISAYYSKKEKNKIIKRNGKKYKRFSDHIGLLPLVFLIPQDNQIIYEGSQIRRKFIDIIISQYNKEYLQALIQYKKLLLQRNQLLKKFFTIKNIDYQTLEAYDYKFIQLSKYIFEQREKFINQFLPIFTKYYHNIANKNEQVNIIYRSHLQQNDFKKLLIENLNRDLALQYSTVGIHRDDLVFVINDKKLKKFGSNGQQKTFVIALKLAQATILKQIIKLPPILMLDDIFDKLDKNRVAQIVKLITNSHFGQIFITHTNLDNLSSIIKQTVYQQFIVDNGSIKPV